MNTYGGRPREDPGRGWHLRPWREASGDTGPAHACSWGPGPQEMDENLCCWNRSRAAPR